VRFPSSCLRTSAIQVINSLNSLGGDLNTTENTSWMSFRPSDFRRRGTSSVRYLATLLQPSCLQLCR
jgi:hypothetical protein